MATQPAGSQLVVIGASAGGIEALSTLVATLPPDFPAPLVIAQHISPMHASHLQEILAPRSALPVQTVTDHAPLQPGVIYVVPADRHVAIADHALSLQTATRGGSKPSVDLLFKTAAQVFREGLVAVVLTGMGMDGAVGARAVKESGGTVVIQNPRTASYPAMPGALAPTTVDLVADLERIGPLLHDLLTGAYRPGLREVPQTLLAQVRKQMQIDLSGYPAPVIERHLQLRMAAADTHGIAEYLDYLESHPEEYERLVSSFFRKVRQFFGDRELFAYLADTVIPELLAQARARGSGLRIWLTGCATGEETYSLAILLCEALRKEQDHLTIRIFATDRDGAALAFARAGIYSRAVLVDMRRDLRERYFRQVNDAYQIQQFTRNLVVFGQHDLAERMSFRNIDLCLSRNSLQVFTPELQTHILQRFAFALHERGYLVLDKADATTAPLDYFVPVQRDLKIFQRQGEHSAAPLTQLLDMAPMTMRTPAHALPAHQAVSQRAAASPTEPRAEDVLRGLPTGVVVVDRHYDIQIINDAARHLLGIYRATIGEDLVHLMHTVPPALLREGIDAALRGEDFSTVEDIVTDIILPGTTSYLRLSCSPYHRDESGQVDSVLIMVLDNTAMARHQLAQEQDTEQTQRVTEAEMTRLQSEVVGLQAHGASLAATNRGLLAANDELATMNRTLQSASNSALLYNADIQMAAEEVETLNEELQAGSEELLTLNEELHATIEELNVTNEDLEARSRQLQEQTVSLEEQRWVSESQRQRLREIFAQTPALLALTHGPTHAFELASRAFLQEIGYTEEALTSLTVQDVWPAAVAARLVECMDAVFTTGVTASVPEVPVQVGRNPSLGAEEAYWTFEFKQMRMISGEIEGVLLAAIDMTDQVRSRRHIEALMSEASAAQVRLEAILANMADAVLVVDIAAQPVISNIAYDRLLGAHATVPMEDDEGRPLTPDMTPAQRAARGESFSMQFTVRTTDGGRRWFEANGHPIATASGDSDVEHWGLVVIRDITDRNLRRLREEFVASVSHELQTPLTAIRASLGMLATTLAERLDTDEHELLDGARQHVERLRVQIDDLLAANQIEAGTLRLDFEPCDVRTAVNRAASVVQPLLAQKGQTLQIDLPEPLPILGDSRRLEQIFVNLLANAHRHTPAGTHVVVEGHATPNLVHMVVRDNGPGILPESLEEIFDRFYRANSGASGSGLGLAITHTLIELHRGRIWAESTLGQGAAFHIDLPASGQEGEP